MRSRHIGFARPSTVESLERRRMMDAAPGEVTLSVTSPSTGHTYHLLAPTTWDDAEAESIALGGHLVVVNDPPEQDFLWSTFGPLTGIFWIGFTDGAHEGRYAWTTGEPPTYTNWFAGEPNNLYPSGERWGNMWVDYGGQWNDLGPDSPQGTSHFAVAEVRNGPDLFATLGGVPSSLQPGDAFELSGTLKNLGSVTSTGPTRVAYFLSTDTTLDAGDRALSGDVSVPGELPFNQSVPLAASLAVPADAQPGTYFVLAKVDADETLGEADEANNVTASGALDVGAVLEPVFRTLRGFVRDVDDLPLHGVSVTAGEQTVFTDYDGTRKALDRDGVNGDFELVGALVGHNVTFGGAFSRFVPADAGDAGANLTAVANDLAGSAFTRSVDVDEILTLDVTQPDGGLAPRTPAALRPIFLTDYSTVADDAAGTIRLHKDLRNDRNSDRISAKPNKSVAASARYRKGVELVTARLGALGFREAAETPLTTMSALSRNSPAERAVKLFKDVLGITPAGSRKPKATGTIDEAALAALNANPPSAAPLWTNVLPAKWSVVPDVTDAYVSRSTFEKMRALAEGSPVAEFVLTRASPSVGGTGKTFRAGDEIEFRWAYTPDVLQVTQPFWEPLEGFERRDITLVGGRKLGVPDPAQLGVRWRYVTGYDQAATRDVVLSLLATGVTRVMFNDPAILQELGAVTISAGTNGKSAMTVVRQDLTPGAGYDAVIYARF